MKRTGLILLFVCISLMVCSTAQAYKLPDTGQTNCYDSAGTAVDCAGTRQNGAYRINPMNNYVDNEDGTVTDNFTGLVWRKCSIGQSGNDCAGGSAIAHNYSEAVNDCAALGSEWRLPTKKELQGLVNYGTPYTGSVPVIDPVFENTVADTYWTNTVWTLNSGMAWQVYFEDGGADFTDKTDTNYVRCVQGAEVGPSFTDNGNTVTDNSDNLMWQKGEPGLMQWATALDYCSSLTLDNYTDWRLPNIKELEFLASDTLSNPAIAAIFSGAQSSEYWSSTSEANWLNAAWYVDFIDGMVDSDYDNKSASHYVRCVRAGGDCITEPVQVGGARYGTVQEAYTAASSGNYLQLRQQLVLIENLDFIESKTIYLAGGYDCDFLAPSGFSYLYGKLTIRGDGQVIIDKLAIK